MRKIFVLITCLVLMHGHIMATEKDAFERIMLGVSVMDVNDTPIIPGKGKAPVRIPRIYKNGHLLLLSSSHPEYLLNIVQNDVVVFSSIIPEGVTEFEIPTLLEGEFTIRFVSRRYCVTGIIIL